MSRNKHFNPYITVNVWDDDLEKALRIFKGKVQKANIFRAIREKNSYEKPSEKKARVSKQNKTRVEKRETNIVHKPPTKSPLVRMK